MRDKYGKTIKVKRPVFDVLYSGDGKRIFRDIPNAAFDLIFNTIFTYHKDLLMLVALQAFAGLRPSEACNVRRQDSALGPGMIFHYLNHGEDGDDIVTVELDLRKELTIKVWSTEALAESDGPANVPKDIYVVLQRIHEAY